MSKRLCHILQPSLPIEASESYHKALCGKDIGWLYDVDGSNKPRGGKLLDKDKAVEGALWLLVIVLCVQEGCHPLAHHLIARLTYGVLAFWQR